MLCLLYLLALAAEPLPKIDGVGPAGPIAALRSGFWFVEGPVGDGQNGLFFTDIIQNRVLHLDEAGRLTNVLTGSSLCNGLAIDANGDLLACQGGTGRIVQINAVEKTATPIVEQYAGKRFNQPNDLVVDGFGGFYFTDPIFVSKEKPQGVLGVYYVDAKRRASRVVEDLPLPNGIALSPDGKTLYVLCMGRPVLMSYDVLAPGKLSAGRILAEPPVGGDGMTVDSQGRLYLTQPSRSSVLVVGPDGGKLGEWRFPQQPSNCAFMGKDRKTFVVTARSSLYTLRLEAQGLPAPKSP